MAAPSPSVRAATTPAYLTRSSSPTRRRPPAAPPVAPIPQTGLVLIGTPETVRALHAQSATLGTASNGPGVVAGCVLLGHHVARNGSDEAAQTADALNLPILGTPDDLPALHARYRFRLALVSIPAVMRDAITRLRATLRTLALPERFVPTLDDLLSPATPSTEPSPAPSSDHLPWRPAPAIDLAALMARPPRPLDPHAVSRILAGKRVLITGAGGSIGGEIARLAAGFTPELLILMERSENALFEIDRQIARRFPAIPRRAVLHDVTDAEGTLRHLAALRPHAVFHAAAHKHVPLMEDHPAHAVTNNLFGTKSIADAAVAVGAERFVMISSDKAVNPTSVMGATKRLAEIYVRSLAAPSCATRLSMVRFGNVLGSACSVLAIWSTQLSEGGPITVTDPRMTRYFMTIPEAATLVLQSATLDAHPASPTPTDAAPVYVLDMGEPIRIVDLAARFVRAHGLEIRLASERGADLGGQPAEVASSSDRPMIDIDFTGARPGEKLHEELAYAAELLRPTGSPGINAWAPPSLPSPVSPTAAGRDRLAAMQMIADLSAARANPDHAAVLAAIRRHVPEMVCATA